jgi:hypothetical protein
MGRHCACWNAIGGPAIAQPFGVVGQHFFAGVRSRNALWCRERLGLIAVDQLQRAVEGVGVRPRQDGERGQPRVMAVGEPPGDAAAPVMADQMKARVAIAASATIAIASSIKRSIR